MAKQEKAKNTTWQVVNPETMPKAHQAAYAAYKAKYAEASALRKVFEDMVNGDAKATLAPQGKTMIFGYNFGQLSMGIGDIAGTVSKKAVSLADFMSAAKTGGHKA